METFKSILEIIDSNLIYPLPSILLTILIGRLIFKSNLKSEKALGIVRWFIIIYSVIAVLYMVFALIIEPNEYAFVNRATGPYWFAYWLMFVCAVLLPFTLLIEKFGRNIFYLLVISFLIKIGAYFEMYVILVTSFHRDYLSDNESQWTFYPLLGFLLTTLQGIILGITLLATVQFISKKKAVRTV